MRFPILLIGLAGGLLLLYVLLSPHRFLKFSPPPEPPPASAPKSEASEEVPGAWLGGKKVPLADCGPSLFVFEINGRKSRGFCSLHHGQPALFANASGLGGHYALTMQSPSGQSFEPEALFLDETTGLVRFDEASLPPPLDLLEDMKTTVSAGDEVVVLAANPDGTVTTHPGRVTKIEPERVEIDSDFSEEDIGSPVIHLKSGKLLGLATLVTRKQLTGGKPRFQATEIRSAARIDPNVTWEKSAWAKFASESTILTHIQARTDDFWALGNELDETRALRNWPLHLRSNNAVRDLVSAFQKTMARGNLSGPDELKAKLTLLNGLLARLESDLLHLDPVTFTKFHQKQIREEAKIRNDLKAYFGSLLKEAQSDPTLLAR